MAWPLIAAAGVLAVGGAVASGIGAGSRARATRQSATQGIRRISRFTQDFSDESEALRDKKLGILEDSESIFDRLGGFIFGNTNSLNSLREAQSEFSALAAGDTSGFTREIESIVKSALSGTFGAPTGAFENLSARNLFNFRSQGLQNALSVTNQLSSLGAGLINTEFGIHDSDFETRLRLRENEVNAINNLSMQRAQTAGTNAAAIGNVLTTAGGALTGINSAMNQGQASGQYNLIDLVSALQQINSGGAGQAIPVYGGGGGGGGSFTPISFPSISSIQPASNPVALPSLPVGGGVSASDGLLPPLQPFSPGPQTISAFDPYRYIYGTP